MGWYATRTAIITGTGPYGSVRQSLNGESEPHRTLVVAIEQIDREIKEGGLCLNRNAKIRLSYWSRRCGYSVARPNTRLQATQPKPSVRNARRRG